MALTLAKSLDKAATLCPELAFWWTNYTFNGVVLMNLDTELPPIMCMVSQLQQMGSDMNTNVSVAAFVIGPVGIISSSLALFVLSSKKCSEVTFYYHRAINVADIIWLLFVVELGVYNLLAIEGKRYSAWEGFHTIFGNRIDNCFSDFVELTVAWISVERATTYLPKVFLAINQKKTALIMICLLFIVALAVIMPYAFELTLGYDDTLLIYKRIYSSFGSSTAFKSYSAVYNAILTVRLILVIVGACATIGVFLLINHKKRHLAASVGSQSTASASLLRQAKANQMLCVLQLCEAVPIIIKCIMILNLQSLTLGFTFSTFMQLKYNDALALISQYKHLMSLMAAKQIVNYSSHALHFTLYCCLSKRIRATAGELLKRAFVPNNSSSVSGKRSSAVDAARHQL